METKNYFTQTSVPYRLLEDLVDPDDCRRDADGGCDAHDYPTLSVDEVCPQAELKALIEYGF